MFRFSFTFQFNVLRRHPGSRRKFPPRRAGYNPHALPGVPSSPSRDQPSNGNFRSAAEIQKNETLYLEGYFGDALLRDKTEREKKIEALTEEVFSKGNNYVRSVDEIRILPLGRLSFPEVAICGGTQSGKSRLCATILHNGKVARVSPKAGSTNMLKFFNVGGGFMLVDTPGYGGEWNKYYHDRIFHRVRAQSLVKQYINIRKHSNLKRVYVCIAADVGLRYRDKEFIRFLAGEGVPFTIVMTMLDALAKSETSAQSENHFREIMAEIPIAAKRIFDELGTDQIPFIEVNSRSGYNVDALQKDMVFHCCQDIADDEHIDYKHLQELSYSPPSAAAFIAAEARYAPEHELMIDQDDITDVQYLEDHKREVQAESDMLGGAISPLVSLEDYAQNKHFDKFFSVGSTANEGIPAALEFGQGITNNKFDTGTYCLPLTEEGKGQEKIPSSSSAIVKRSEQLEESEIAEQYGFSQQPQQDDDEEQSSQDIQHENPSIILASKVFTTPPPPEKLRNAADSTSSSSVVLRDFDEGPPLVHKATNSLIQPSLLNTLSKIDKSAHKYKAMIENGWNTVMDDSNEFFLQHHENLGLKGNIKYQRQQVLKRYVDKNGLKKDLPMKLDAQGFMNPFVGQDHSSSNVVVGMSNNVQAPSSARGTSRGGLMLGLKQKGFGGNAYSDKTFKGRGRKTRKLHEWAR